MNNLALSYARLRRLADALKLHEETLAIQLRVLPQHHPETLKSMHNLANCYADLKRHADALKLYEDVLVIQKQVLPQHHPDTLLSLHNLARCYADLNRHADAIKLREELLTIRKRELPKDHPDTILSMHSLASSYAALNRHADALKLREETLTIRKRVLSTDHPETIHSMLFLADSLIALDRGVEALPFVDEFLAKSRSNPSVNPRFIPIAFGLRIRHFQKVGDPAGCRATAEMYEKLSRTDIEGLYDAACWRAVTAAVQAKTAGADAARLAHEDVERAMDWLQKAVKAGYKDAAHLKKDPDLDPLSGREDFKKLIAELEAKAEKK